ncbi:MAG TPA: hypothetical protein VJZ71_15665 [Phycisphaerae bacterium]|nr:hypothetical protein [Phycisphaerae bacterium]
MNSWIKIFAVGCGLCFFVVGMACERKPAQPAKTPPPTAPTAAPAPGNDMKGLAEFLNKDGSTGGSTAMNSAQKSPSGALPPGHPPLGGATTTQPADGGLPPGHPPLGAGQPMMPPGDEGVVPLKYDAPAEWKSQTPSSAMRKAQFLLPRAADDKEDGQMIVFQFGKGQGGAVEMNIQRWVGMFTTKDGQPVGNDGVKRETREVNGLKVTTLDVAGNFADAMMGMSTGAPKENYRMLAAIIETPDGPWFFKGVGPNATMDSHREGFIKMLDTIKR